MILIYGGSGAIGRAVAERLAAAGTDTHLVGRDAAKLAAVAAPLGAGVTAGDVADPDLFVRATAAAAPDGRLDGLVYAVGNIRLKPFHRLSDEEVLADFSLNALGALHAVQAARQALVAAKGAVVLFSTVAVGQGFGMHASIAMAKGAVEALARTLAAELAPDVRVNAIAPSLTVGGMGDRIAGSDKLRAALGNAHPLKRLGEGKDVAALAAALLEPGGWITGQVIGVDGGRGTLRLAE
jgi:NAD(P)-dependent dehydrogenase (short-subunit alcohol dehydrogenase family)